MDVGVLITPRVPGSHALPEQCDVLVVRHGSTSNSGAAPNDSTVRSGAPQRQSARQLACPSGDWNDDDFDVSGVSVYAMLATMGYVAGVRTGWGFQCVELAPVSSLSL
jgi:hypothetical protein